MIKKSVFITMLILLAAFSRLFAQPGSPKGKVEVLAVKGTIVFKGTALKKEDIIEFAPKDSAVSQLMFSNATDWVKVMEIGTKKVYHFYKQKKYACANCLGTKGGDSYINNGLDFVNYFWQKPIFIFGADTLICHGNSIKTDSVTVPVFQFVLNGKTYNKIVGSHDTIIISHDHLFDFSGDDMLPETSYSMASFLVDSIRLIYFNQKDKSQIRPDLPYFHIFFFQDAVYYLNNMGLNEKEIFLELMENFVKLPVLMKNEDLSNLEEAEEWLRKEIKTILQQ